MRDITGLRSGKLVALEPTEKRANGCVVWRCQCDCGREAEVSMDALVRGWKKSCGCMRNTPKIDLTGWTFDCLTVVGTVETKGKWIRWRCRCDCGNEIVTTKDALINGKVVNCGCQAKPKTAREIMELIAMDTGGWEGR